MNAFKKATETLIACLDERGVYGSRVERERKSKLNYLIWMVFKGGGGILRGSNYF